jgi:hypothetical protein
MSASIDQPASPSARRRPVEESNVSSLLVSMILCVSLVTWFLITFEGLAHWFIAPVLVCGIVIGMDVADYFRGKMNLYDPAGIIGIFGFHFFFTAPLLHVGWNSWLEYVTPPPDWREWLGWMATINAAGLCLYRGFRERAASWGGPAPTGQTFELNKRRFIYLALASLLISGSVQVWFYLKTGGVLAYIEAVTADIGKAEEDSIDRGMGWVFMISESFPIIFVMLYAVVCGRKKFARSSIAIIGILLVFFLLRLYFGGLRGSRSTIIWALFWAVGVVHLWIRPLTMKFVLAGMIFLAGFMYAYGFYKGLGRDVVAALETGDLEGKSKRRFDSMLLGDLGRADVQAFLLYRIMRQESDYHLAWGRTYLGTMALLIPHAIWPDRPPIKTKEGTDAYYGAGTYARGEWRSSSVYGIAGETMLNFGPWIVPLAYGLFGVVVGRLRRFLRFLQPGDARMLLLPLAVLTCFSVLVSDSDNLLFNAIKDGLVPCLVVWCSSTRFSIRRTTPIHAVPGSRASLSYS